eukprot:4253066-Pyramimonas_sp.AAC.1
MGRSGKIQFGIPKRCGDRPCGDLEIPPKTSPHGPSTHGFGTSDAPVARDVLGEGLEFQNRAG